MAYTPQQLRDPVSGETVTAANAKEYNDLRYGSGYKPVPEKRSSPKKDEHKQPETKTVTLQQQQQQ